MASETARPLCTMCRNHIGGWMMPHTCVRLTGRTNPIDGAVIKVRACCDTERTIGACGPYGKLFQPRPKGYLMRWWHGE